MGLQKLQGLDASCEPDNTRRLLEASVCASGKRAQVQHSLGWFEACWLILRGSPRPRGSVIRGGTTRLIRQLQRCGRCHPGSQPSADQVVFITELGKLDRGANNESLFCC